MRAGQRGTVTAENASGSESGTADNEPAAHEVGSGWQPPRGSSDTTAYTFTAEAQCGEHVHFRADRANGRLADSANEKVVGLAALTCVHNCVLRGAAAPRLFARALHLCLTGCGGSSPHATP